MKGITNRIMTAAAVWAGLSVAGHAQVTVAPGSANIFVPTIARNATNEAMLQVNIKNNTGSPASEITGLTVTAGGTADDAADLAAGGVRLFWDKNGDGRLNTGGANEDVELGTSAYGADDGTVAFAGFTVPLAASAQVNFIVLYTLGPSATAGKTLQARIVANTDVSVRRADTQAAVSATGAPVNGFTRTVGTGTLTLTRNTQSPDGATAIPNRKLIPLLWFKIAANDVEAVNVASFDFLDVGTANLATNILPGTVRLFSAPNSTPPTNAALALASGGFSADGGRVTLTPVLPVSVPRAGSLSFWVTADMPAESSGGIGSSLQIQIPNENPFAASGAFSTDMPAVVGSPLNGPPWEFNYNPVSISLNSSADAGAVLMPANALNYPVAAFQVKNDTIARFEAADITSMTFRADGTMNDVTAVSAVKLYKDVSPTGRVGAGDVLLGQGVYNGDNGSLTINFSTSVALAVGGTVDLLLAYDLNGTAVDGQTARVSVLSRNDFTIIGQTSLVNAGFSNAPFRGAFKTVGNPRATFTLDTNEKNVGSITAPGATNIPILGFKIATANDEDLKLAGLNLAFTGPLDETQFFDAVRLYSDTSGDGLVGAGEPVLAEGNLTANGGDGLLQLTIPEEVRITIPRQQNKSFILVADTKTSLVGDGTEIYAISAAQDPDVLSVGALSGAVASYTSTLPPFSVNRTVRNPAITLGTFPNIPQDRFGCINGGYGMMGVRFNVPSGENIVITRVRFSVAGTLFDPTFTVGAFSWHDQNSDLYVDSGEYGLPFGFHFAENPITVDNGSGELDFGDTPGPIDRTTNNFNISTGLDFEALDPPTAIAQIGKTDTMFQIGNLVLEGYGVRSNRPLEVTNPAGADQGRTLTFDKGTLAVSTYSVARTEAPPNGDRMEVLGLYLKTQVLEPVVINRMVLTPVGTIDESRYIKPGGIRIYMEAPSNGKFDATGSSDTLIAQVDPPAVDGGQIILTEDMFQSIYKSTVYSFSVGGSPHDHWLVTVDLTDDAPEGTTVRFELASVNDITATGGCSLYPYTLGGEISYPQGLPPLQGPEVLVKRGRLNIVTDSGFAGDADNKPNVTMAPAAVGYEVGRINVKASDAEDIQLAGLTFQASGTANDAVDLAATTGVSLYKGSITTANRLAQGGFTTDNGALQLTFASPLLLKRNETQTFYITFDGTGTGRIGDGIDLTIPGTGLLATGVTSSLPINQITPSDPYAAIPVLFGTGTLTVRADEADDFLLPLAVVGGSKIQRLNFLATRTEKILLDEITVHAMGSANEVEALENSAVILNYRASSGATPTPVASAPVTVDNGEVTLRNLNIQVAADQDTGLRHSIDGVLSTNGIPIGSTLRFDVDGAAKVKARGEISGLPVKIVLDDLAGGDNLSNTVSISGRKVTVSSGLVTLTKGGKNPANASIAGNETNLPLMQISGKVEQKLEAVTVNEIVFCYGGTQDPSQVIGSVRLYNDANNDGLASPSDVLLGTAAYVNEGGTFRARFTGLALTYPANATFNWLLVADLTGLLQPGGTISAAFCTPAVAGTGQITQLPLNPVIGSPAPVGAVYTLPNNLSTVQQLREYLLGQRPLNPLLDLNGDGVVDVADLMLAVLQN